MAITRYFSPSPRIMGPLQFLAGFGQERSRVHEQEASWDFQQQMQEQQLAAQRNAQIVGAAIGFGMQQTGQMGQQALIQGAIQSRLQGAAWQDARDAYVKAGGAPGQPPPGIQMGPAAPAAGPPPAAGQPVAQPTTVRSDFMGPPAPGQVQTQPIELTTPQVAPPEPLGVPLPVIDPSAIGDYRKKEEQLRLYQSYKATLDTDPFIPPEKYARETARLAQAIAPLQAFLRKHPKPQPPRTYEELAAAGPMGGGFTPIPGTYNYAIPDGKGGVKVSTAVHPKEDMGWMTIPDPVKRSEAKRADLEDHRVMLDDDEYLWDGKQWKKQREERDDFDWGDYIQTGSGKISSDTGKPLFTMDELISQASQVDSAIDQARLQQTIQEAPDAPAILNLVKSRAYISPEKHERLIALNVTEKTRRLTPDELGERGDLAEEWLDALAAMEDAGVQWPARLKAELRKEYDLLISFVEAGRRP